MRTRNQANRLQPATTTGSGDQQGKPKRNARASSSRTIDDNETLSNISRGAVGKLLKRVKKRGFDREDVDYLRHLESEDKPVIDANGNEKAAVHAEEEKESGDPVSRATDAINQDSSKEEEKVAITHHSNRNDDDQDDFEWEDGSIPALSVSNDYGEGFNNGVSVQFEVSPAPAKRKPVRRATAEEKEVAEFVHKVHLLCLLGRGRLIDAACNDPLLQASLLSLLPSHLLKIADGPNLTVDQLTPLVSWIYKNFRVRSSSITEESCHLMLKSTLETQEGTPEAVAALSVALFRALNLTCRFVSIMDVVSFKPDAENSESTPERVSKGERDIFNSSTLMVSGKSCSLMKSSSEVKQQNIQTPARDVMNHKAGRSRTRSSQTQKSVITHKPNNEESVKAVSEPISDASESCLNKSEGLKRKGDIEFQMQLEMAMTSTAVGSSLNIGESPSTSTVTTPYRRMKKIRMEKSECSSSGVSLAIGSLRAGAPLYWAEVFCSGENLTGKWVHVDAVNSVIDGELKVENAATAFKKSLRYVVAFAGSGAKDVTRRYCTKWHKVASQRISMNWWDAVLRPLKELESGATNCVDQRAMMNSSVSTRSSLEDMELETRALTEPLPTNQQAYRNHHLYVIERWIKKYEILYPKGPVLGICSGHAVYPRTCVQALHTRERWLREGLQIKAGELPVKILKRSLKRSKEEADDDRDECPGGDHERSTDLYGKWQTEPLCLPHAVNGIVPKNERGQVDVWSEKCLPPGTVHVRLPRVASIARRLEIDFAPAMVGFDFRNGKYVPVFEGIVVCAEFKGVILEAYAEEQEKREAEEKKRNEAQALARWYQLFSSIITRQRLNNSYGDASSSHPYPEVSKSADKGSKSAVTNKVEASPRCQEMDTAEKQSGTATFIPSEIHEHKFVLDDRATDEEGTVRLKRCRCGFSVEFEEL